RLRSHALGLSERVTQGEPPTPGSSSPAAPGCRWCNACGVAYLGRDVPGTRVALADHRHAHHHVARRADDRHSEEVAEDAPAEHRAVAARHRPRSRPAPG